MTKKRQMEEIRKQDKNSTCGCFHFSRHKWWGEGGSVNREVEYLKMEMNHVKNGKIKINLVI